MIRLFISSTFSDMQEEREWIHREVYPELREYGLKKGVPVDICDLRWGIHVDNDGEDEEKEKKEKEEIRKIMEVCLWEVSNCDPYIVAMIGNRHGTRPEKDVQNRIAEIWRRYRGDDSLPEEGTWTRWSLTQWELEFSFLTSINPDVRATCMFRESRGEKEENDVFDDLKERIIAEAKKDDPRVSMEEYREGDREAFAQLLSFRVKAFIDEKAQEQTARNPAEVAFAESDAYAEEKTLEYYGRDGAKSVFDVFLKERKQEVLAYYGESGIGKSSLMAHLYREVSGNTEKYGRVDCRLITCGASEYSSDYLNLLKQVIYAVKCHMEETPHYPSELYSAEIAETRLHEALRKCSNRAELENRPLILFIDALDKVSGIPENGMVEIFLEHEGAPIQLVCSRIQPYTEDVDGMQTYEIGLLEEEEIRGILTRKLFSDYHMTGIHKNNPAVMAAVKKRNSGQPLYLDFMIMTLKMRMAEIIDTAERDRIIADRITEMPEEIEDLCRMTIRQAVDSCLDLDEQEKAQLWQAVQLITVTRHGLREIELENIIDGEGWRPRDFSILRRYLYNCFRQQGNGTWVFEHDNIHRSMLDQDEKALEQTREKLYSYITDENCKDIELISREGLYLSMRNDDIPGGVRILKLTGTYGNYANHNTVRTTAAIELYGILTLEDGRDWYRRLIDEDREAVMLGLAGLMEMRGSDDYDRQYPSKLATDLFWKETGLMGEKSLRKYTGTEKQEENVQKKLLDARGFERAKAAALLCTEYCNVCEGMNVYSSCREYLHFALSFWLDTLTEYRDQFDDDIDQAELKKIARHINNLFFTNNKNLNDAIKNVQYDLPLSKKVIEVIDGKGVRGEIPETRALYNSNIGQYYNALGAVSKARDYHFNSLKVKAETLLSREVDTDEQDGKKRLFEETWYEEFLKLCSGGWSAIVEEEHRAFWERVWVHIRENVKSEDQRFDGVREEWTAIGEEWKVIGVSYRTIVQDCAKVSLKSEDYLEDIRIACAYARLSVFMLENTDLVGTVREPLISRVRYVQMLGKVSEDELAAAVDDACNVAGLVLEVYRGHARQIGPTEGRYMRGNLDAILERIEDKPGFSEQKKTIQGYAEGLGQVIESIT